MAEIQWQLLRTPDFAADYDQGAQAGRQQAQFNALKGYATDPQGAINGLIGAGNPGAAAQLQAMNTANTQAQARTQAAQQYTSGDAAGAMSTALASANDQLLATFRQ